ncbi:hypothetical protein CGL56_03770 [Neolewinella marina]|uniref:Uncharacterized protein n=1 Tax=Neolewinella marina TaxID=438751 RepID=A0A2G0CJL9_9BACT|nr:hypothetical protein CGL56_03770 [Neolewinella marina]
MARRCQADQGIPAGHDVADPEVFPLWGEHVAVVEHPEPRTAADEKPVAGAFSRFRGRLASQGKEEQNK